MTPPQGFRSRSWGPATTDFSDGVHRPLGLTALAFRGDDGPPLVLVTVEVGWWKSPREGAYVREGALEAAGGDEARVLLHVTHSHSGPTGGLEDGEIERAYLTTVRDAARAAVREAIDTAVPATFEAMTGRCGLAVHRDLRDGDRFVVGFDPSTPADDTLLVGRAADRDGRVLATLVNYACHPTTLAWQNRLISPDFVGRTQELVEETTGGAPCLFLQGASGELSPRHQYHGDIEVADRHGAALGHAAASVLHTMPPPGAALAWTGVVESGAPLAIWEPKPHEPSSAIGAERLEVELDLQPVPDAAEMERRWPGMNPVSLAERQRRAARLRALYGDRDTFPYPLWVWRLGDVFVVAHPGEAYSALQVELRARHPDKAVFVANLTNGPGGGYLPPRALYTEDAYQVWQSPYGAGGHERLLAAADDALARLG